jgi:hypothetical protein
MAVALFISAVLQPAGKQGVNDGGNKSCPGLVLGTELGAKSMGSSALLLLVIGCTASLDTCRELPAPQSFYAAAEECETDRGRTVAALASHHDHVFAACAAFDPDLIEADVEITWNVTHEKGLEIALAPLEGPAPELAAGVPEMEVAWRAKR